MAYWLVKSEPSSYSWDQLVADGQTNWDGVRNPQALNNLRAMQAGDRVFFYHSGEGREIVGIVEVAKPFYPDPADKSGKLGMVDVKPVMPVSVKIGLPAMRARRELSGMSLLRQSRLSVCPVSPNEWRVICEMAGIPA
ncbi:MAG: EVE domain-containing protein [Alphaproteobacteria bacterium]|nr:EVE domain-containing protein [Alphaproteobacteria bacterium]MBV8335408.1 EVE domain-containing protein [Alphaproteobacteria bacterium]